MSRQPTVSPPQNHLSVFLTVSLSFLPSRPCPFVWAFTGQSTTLLSTVQEAHVVRSQEADQQPLRSGPQFPHLQEEGSEIYQGLENCPH